MEKLGLFFCIPPRLMLGKVSFGWLASLLLKYLSQAAPAFHFPTSLSSCPSASVLGLGGGAQGTCS